MIEVKDRDKPLTSEELKEYGIVKADGEGNFKFVSGYNRDIGEDEQGNRVYTLKLAGSTTWLTEDKKDYRVEKSNGDIINPNGSLFPPKQAAPVQQAQEITDAQKANVKKTMTWILNNLPVKEDDWESFGRDNFWRSTKSNTKAGGNNKSNHLQGLAADLTPKGSTGLTNKDLATYLFVEKPDGLGEVIWYTNSPHLHVDTSGTPSFRIGTKSKDGDKTTYEVFSPDESEKEESIRKVNAYIRGKAETTAPAPVPAAPAPAADPVSGRNKCEDVKKEYKGLRRKIEKTGQELIDYKKTHNVPISWEIAVRKQKHFEDIKPKSPLGLPLLKSRKEKYVRYKELYLSYIEAEKEQKEYEHSIPDELRRECWPKFSSSLRTNEISQKVRSLVKEEIRKLFDPT